VNIIKSIEELDPNAVVLPNIVRSLQLDFYSCGVQSVFVILNYFRKSPSVDTIERELQTDHTGTSLGAMERVFKKRGFKCWIIRKLSLKQIRDYIDADSSVLITTLDRWRYAVVYGYSEEHVFVVDPSVRCNLFCRIPKKRFLEQQWDKWMMVASS